jgi:hypothetical protein
MVFVGIQTTDKYSVVPAGPPGEVSHCHTARGDAGMLLDCFVLVAVLETLRSPES